MKYNIKTSAIEVFPVAKQRSIEAPGTRIFTEKNVSNLSRQLLSNEHPGYIISCKQITSNKFDIAFNLYGYYFNVQSLEIPINSNPYLYACIVIEDETGEIIGQDTDLQGEGEYKGLTITDDLTSVTAPSGADIKYIQLFERFGSEWRCVAQNFGLVSALFIGGIDGKHD